MITITMRSFTETHAYFKELRQSRFLKGIQKKRESLNQVYRTEK